MIDAIYCAKTFYTIEALKVTIAMNMEFGRKSQERLFDDLMDYRSRYLNKLKQAFYDYSAMTVYGEMRHGVSSSTVYNPQVPQEGSRYKSYLSARQYNPTSILLAGERLFGNGDWSHAYGGEKWKVIANRVLLKDKIDDGVYCDTCFSLSHNSSPYLDKDDSDIFKIEYIDTYKKLLDLKFNAEDPMEIIEHCLMSCGAELKKLVKRAVKVKLLPNRIMMFAKEYWNKEYECYAESFILNYKPIEWGTSWLEAVAIQHRKRLGDSEFSALPTYVDSDNVHEGDVLEIKYDRLDGFEKIKKGMLVKVVGKTRYSRILEVVFEENVDGHNLDGKCRDGYGLRLSCDYFKKHIA